MAGIKGPGEARSYDGSSLRIGIIHARWNTQIIDSLLKGTLSALHKAGVPDSNITIQSVPGSYELPYAVATMHKASQTQAASSAVGPVGGFVGSAVGDLLGGSTSDLKGMDTAAEKQQERESLKSSASTAPFDAIIAIGALIKGSTMHFEYISDAVSHGLMKVQMELGVPVIFGLLTLLNEQQGLERAGIGGSDGKQGHNHGEDWGSAAVELGCKRKAWAEGRFID
ncbi:hypothetical protein BAUCODRAFT_117780 [Baudoinia panamericana UAMH 10762]|uniref:6,7-dimethyl-8-ribityllumazine synthase n=1 Tax=Baudoinia panamericana (strain UAMH 10762) TaxID=717646 RepID=M2MJA5_BAUPA|nr:uncharacterized protein BAUCODRAFT_117780 [Baudoinia panamericana UAMH 10762]EMC91363.1 hypothetical protein BAUCODRAFT_117780 [Baudoinia panamericana UAMH 10762]